MAQTGETPDFAELLVLFHRGLDRPGRPPERLIRMSPSGPMLQDEDFAQLSYTDKLSLSLALFKSYGLRFVIYAVAVGFLLGLAGAILGSLLGVNPSLVFSAQASAAATAAMLSRFLFVFFIMAVLYAFFTLGLNSLALRYIEGYEPEQALPFFLAPWTRAGPVFLTVVAWLTLMIVYQMLLAIPSSLPYVGLVFEVLGSVLLSVFINCALFHGADKLPVVNPGLSVATTWVMVSKNFVLWLNSVFTLLVLGLPGLISAIMILRGGAGLSLGPVLIGLVYWMAVSIYGLFLLALTYRQSRALTFPPSGPAATLLN